MARVTQFRTDPNLCELLVTRSFDALNWMRQKGIRFVPIYGRQAFKIDGRFKFWGGLRVETVGGGEVVDRSFSVLRPGGRAAFIGSGATAPIPPRADVASLRPKVGRDRAHLERIVELVESGAVRVPEIKVYPLSEAAAAHKVSEGRHLRGKLVFKVR